MSVKDDVCNFESLYKAMKICRKGVSWKDSVAKWSKNGISNCIALEADLENDEYSIDPYTHFVIYEPKKRDIVSTRFKDRVFQRSLCDNYLTKQLSKSFIYDNAACLRRRGTDFSRNRLTAHLQKFYRKHGTNGYVLQCDITDFFGSTSHEVAKEKVRKYCEDDWVYSELCRIIDSFGSDTGLGLGSQTTQLVQLTILNDLDHGIKEKKRIKHYLRYMDDFILIHEDKEVLKDCLNYIKTELKELDLTLSEKKTKLYPITQPIHFLGFSFQLTDSGKVIKRVLSKKFSRERKRIKKYKSLVAQGKMTEEKMDECFEAWIAAATGKTAKRRKGKPFQNRTNDYFKIQKLLRYYNEVKQEE